MNKRAMLIAPLCAAMLLSACGKEAVPETAPVQQAPVQTRVEENPNYNLLSSSEVELSDQDKINLMSGYHYAKTEGYISNEMLKEYIGKDEIASFANLATTYVSAIYNVNGREVGQFEDAYKDKLNQFISSDCAFATTDESFVDKWARALTESEAVFTSTFTTGEDFVYADDTEVYVRGILRMKVESAKDMDKINELLPIDMKVGETHNIVYDIGFTTSGDDAEVVEVSAEPKEEVKEEVENTSLESAALTSVAIEDKDGEETAEAETEAEAEVEEKEEVTYTRSGNKGKIDYIFALGVY